jgi:hypothetical protein
VDLGFGVIPRVGTGEFSTVALRVVRGDKKGTQCPGVYLGYPVPGGYKYGDLALYVGGVSNETIKYGSEFCGILSQEWLLWQGPESIVQ